MLFLRPPIFSLYKRPYKGNNNTNKRRAPKNPYGPRRLAPYAYQAPALLAPILNIISAYTGLINTLSSYSRRYSRSRRHAAYRYRPAARHYPIRYYRVLDKKLKDIS
ncbi:hypothetical protein SODALDRAFT_323815 [Sodiomyces alkalinus F11]|uniref:Uncharacterized protein n=1 Tax=Sodiomyces alkalinus (strain CBS 110278 / VKM F-3762 / F11) TaxID=1314773 RepID=A0A3N2PYK6_SODAK|nr:hypothetical protein SODALDRAFT_323815 [Sodiomyces alkalinus F11]ROT39435.1 hypothetical protein SODALDRAFT_323815 [Sodiomyces alkalinus F11]